MKIVAYIFGGLLLLVISIKLLLFFMFDGGRGCHKNSESVTYAKSLSQQRLAKLYKDMEKFSARNDIPFEGYWPLLEVGQVTPKEFSDLKVSRIRPKEGNIMVEGCFDHYVYLRFEGIGSLRDSSSKRRIILSWGEYEPDMGQEIIWEEKSNSNLSTK